MIHSDTHSSVHPASLHRVTSQPDSHHAAAARRPDAAHHERWGLPKVSQTNTLQNYSLMLLFDYIQQGKNIDFFFFQGKKQQQKQSLYECDSWKRRVWRRAQEGSPVRPAWGFISKKTTGSWICTISPKKVSPYAPAKSRDHSKVCFSKLSSGWRSTTKLRCCLTGQGTGPMARSLLSAFGLIRIRRLTFNCSNIHLCLPQPKLSLKE